MRTLQIWIVEDSAPDVYLIQLALSKTGVPMEIQSFVDGETALEAIESCCEGAATPDIVLLDMNLPKVGGNELLGAIRATPDLAKVRVGVFGQPREKSQPSTPVADCYLRKPGDLDEFVAEIGRALSFLRPEG